MTKIALRKLYKQKRLELNETQLLKMDDLLLIQFQQLSLPSIEYLFSYWPIPDQQEPNVELMARYLNFRYPELKTCYPKIRPNESVMDAILVDEETDFSTNHWGITEPIEGTAIDPLAIQLVFVPLLAFDEKGFRVGYGKGFYDRFWRLVIRIC